MTMNKGDEVSARKAFVGMVFLTVLTGLSFAAAEDAQTDSILAIKGGTVMPVSGEPLDGGIVLIRNGKIEAVGKNVKIPDNADVIDAAGKVIIPGMIGAAGMVADGGRDDEETIASDIYAIDGFDFFGRYKRILSGGVTTVYVGPGLRRLVVGYGAVVKLAGASIDEQILRRTASLGVVLGEISKNPPMVFDPPVPPGPDNMIKPAKKQLPTTRMGQIAALKNAFEKAKWQKRTDPKHIDSGSQSLLDVLERRQDLRVTCHTAVDIRNAIALAKQYKLKLIIQGATEAYKVIDELKASGASVIVDLPVRPGSITSRDNTRDISSGRISEQNIAALADADIPFALASENSRDLVDLRFLAGYTVSRGLSTEDALKAVTLGAAKILGVADRTGSIEKGKDADLLILSGDPFELGSKVERTIVGGKTVYVKPTPQPEANSDDSDGKIIAIKAGTILTATRGRITQGLILVRDGKIIYAGKAKAIPEKAKVIDASGKVVMPGMIDIHSHLGLHADSLSARNRSLSATSGANSSSGRLASIVHAIVGEDEAFAEALQSGVTSILLAPQGGGIIQGNAAVVKLAGVSFENLIVKEMAAVKFSMAGGSPRMAKIWQGRDTLKRAKDYADRWDRYEKQYSQYKQKKARSTPDLIKPPDLPGRDPDMELLRGLFKRQMPAIVRVDREDEIRNALKVFADEYNLDVILLGASDAWRMVSELRKYGVGIASGPNIIHYDKATPINNAAILSQKGLRVALHTSATSGTQYLPLSCAYAIHNGMDPDRAFQAVTFVPAQLLHVEDRIGSIEAGKDADIVILSGEPFEFTTQVEQVIVDGHTVYRRTGK